MGNLGKNGRSDSWLLLGCKKISEVNFNSPAHLCMYHALLTLCAHLVGHVVKYRKLVFCSKEEISFPLALSILPCATVA